MQQGIKQENIFVVENGMVVEVAKGSVRVAERVPGGYVFVDGSGVGDVGKTVMRDREVLARDGFITVVINVDATSGRMIGEPEVISRGFIYLRDSDQLIEQVKQTINDVLLTTRNSRNGKRRERLQESISRVLYNETKRRPMVFPIINER
jgi:ribonuclease J